jgi:hypothetical protein
MLQRRFVFIGGLHKSGTNILARALAKHPMVSGFRNTGAPANEGQFLQNVFPSESACGGSSRFGFHPDAAITETSPLVSDENRDRLQEAWSRHWDLSRPVLLEKSSMNLIRTRFLQALFPEAYFLIVVRNPLAVALATGYWDVSRAASLLEHWLVCHERFAEDRPHLRRVRVIAYEDLIERPQATLDDVHSFLGLPPHQPEVDTRHERRRHARYVETWNTLTNSPDAGEREATLAIADKYGSRLHQFGYQLQLPETMPSTSAAAASPAEQRSRKSSPRGPDFLIIGAQKAGTSSLFSYLAEHPNVAPPARKELHFFNRRWAYRSGIESYRALFPMQTRAPDGSLRITGEGTANYMFHLVAEHFPDVKLLVVLRNPPDRAYSHYQMVRRIGGHETLSFEEAIDAEADRLDSEEARMEADDNYQSKAHRRFSYLASGVYVDQLTRWAKFFPREQMLILESRELRARPAETLNRVYEFLGLPDHGLASLKSENAFPYEPMNPRTRERLVEYFAPHNRRLYDYLGVDFGWR